MPKIIEIGLREEGGRVSLPTEVATKLAKALATGYLLKDAMDKANIQHPEFTVWMNDPQVEAFTNTMVKRAIHKNE